MKKFLLVFSLIIILSLCSCRKINQPDDTNYTNSNSSELNSDFSSTTSDFVFPERDDPSTSSINSSRPDPDTSSHDNSSSSETTTAKVSLAIDVGMPYYRTSIKAISFTLYNEYKSKFTYYTDFFLQKYEDGKWKYQTTKSGEINYLFKTAESESYVDFLVLDLRELYDLPLSTGTYRIIQESDDAVITSKTFEIVEDSFFDGEQPQ